MWTQIRIRAGIATEGAIKLVAGNWIAVAGVAIVIVGIVAASTGWDYWAEQTFRSGKLFEIKVDRPKIIQQLLLTGGGIAAFLLAFWRTWTAHQQAKIALRQTDIAEIGQSVDRYASAAGMLDSSRLSVRQAGVYALRELALADSKRHSSVVVQLLCGFCRDRSNETRVELRGSPGEEPQTSEDLLDAVRSISAVASKVFHSGDLTGVILRRKILSDIYLANFVLSQADFSGTSISYFHLDNAEFFVAKLERTRFRFGSMKNAVLNGSTVRGVWFSRVNLSDVDFTDTDFGDVRFLRCELSGVVVESDAKLSQDQVKGCWAWSDNAPILPDGIIIDLYDAGPEGENRGAFEAKVAASGRKHFMTPDAELRVSATAAV
jgi:uncharacterized protein YjbI with pentapeptide repeats